MLRRCLFASLTLTALASLSACDGCTNTANGEGEGDTAGEGEGDGGEGEGEGDFIRDPNPNDPNNANLDSDCDGLSDAEEFGTVYSNGQKTDPGNPDSDGDGIKDGVELGRTSSVDPLCAGHFDGDGDPDSRTDPVGDDTDGDGLKDGEEDANHNGQVDVNAETDPNNPDSDGDGQCDGPNDVAPVCTGGDTDPIPHVADADGDGLCDGNNDVAGVCTAGEDRDADGFVDSGESSPTAVDTDCDGIADPDEYTGGTNPSNADSDGDGILDGIETGAPARGALGACPAFAGDADATTTTDPNNPDSDGDGVPDGAEDPNQNGAVDDGELDPNDATDGTDPTVQAACALGNLVPLLARNVPEADIQVVVPRRDGGAFADNVVLRDGNNTPVGVAGHDRANRVAFIAVHRTPAGADPNADEAQLSNVLNGVGAISNSLTRTFTSWDGFPGVQASYAMAGNVGTKTRMNALINALVGGGAGAFDVTDDPAATSGFVVAAEFVRRSDLTTIALIAITPAELADGPSGFLVKDLGDGSALAQSVDSTGVQCDRLPSEGTAELDILWAVDNSASMADEQAAVAASSDAASLRLTNAGIDFRTAAVTSGYYLPPAGQAACINTSCGEDTGHQCREFTNDLARMATWFTNDAAWFGAGNVNGFFCNVANEQIGRGAQMMLTDPSDPSFVAGTVSLLPPQATPDSLHLQDGGNLLVIFLGDADDQAFPNSNALQGIDSYTQFFRALPMRSVQLGGIICSVTSGTSACGETQRDPRVLRGVIDNFGGIIGDIDHRDTIPDAVNGILDAAIIGASPYVLQKDPITSTVKVAMDAGSTVGACNTADVPRSRQDGFDVDPVTRTVAFFGACRPDPDHTGSLIAISYRTWIDQSPVPDPPQPTCNICGSCTGIERCDLDACACICDGELSCREGFVWDDAVCGCVCDTAALTCDANHNANTDLCGCTCGTNCNDQCDPATDICNPSTCACQFVGGG